MGKMGEMGKYLNQRGVQRFQNNLRKTFCTAQQMQQWIDDTAQRMNNYEILCIVDDTMDAYTIRITAQYTKKQNGTVLGFSNGVFEHLAYTDCLTKSSPTALSERIVLTNSDDIDFHCVVTLSDRDSDHDRDDNAPHNFLAPSDKRTSPNNKILPPENTEQFTVTLAFEENVPFMYVSDMRFSVVNNGGDFTVTYAIENSSGDIVYTHTTSIEGQSGKIVLTPEGSENNVSETQFNFTETIHTVTTIEKGNIFAQ